MARVHGDPFLTVSAGPKAGQVLIAWPSSFSNYFLEYRSDLTPASATAWQSITDNVPIVGGYYFHTNQSADPSRLFRLRR